MIQVRNINGTPEETPNGVFAVHSDENFFYFFTSEDERIAWFKENDIDYFTL